MGKLVCTEGEKVILPETLEAMDIKAVIHSFTASRSRTS